MPGRPSLFRSGSAGEKPCRLEILGQPVSYQLRRSRRRTIGLSVDHRGLRVGAPVGASLRDIEALLHKHGAWVLEKLAAWQGRSGASPLAAGSSIPWLGAGLALQLRSDAGRSRWVPGGVELAVPPGRSLEQALVQLLKPRAKALFQERLACYAARLGVPTPPLFLSSARSRWGSCNSRGEIRLSWRLAHFDLALIDYVVAHELAHLKEMNHSPRFWSVVEQLYPDWRRARAELKRLAPGLPAL